MKKLLIILFVVISVAASAQTAPRYPGIADGYGNQFQRIIPFLTLHVPHFNDTLSRDDSRYKDSAEIREINGELWLKPARGYWSRVGGIGAGGIGNIYAGIGLVKITDSTLRLDTAYTINNNTSYEQNANAWFKFLQLRNLHIIQNSNLGDDADMLLENDNGDGDAHIKIVKAPGTLSRAYVTFQEKDSTHIWNIGLLKGYTGRNTPFQIGFKTGGAINNYEATAFNLFPNGYLGLGKLTPAYRLDVHGYINSDSGAYVPNLSLSDSSNAVYNTRTLKQWVWSKLGSTGGTARNNVDSLNSQPASYYAAVSSLLKKTQHYASVAAMQADVANIRDGAQVITSGYHTTGDGGGNKYVYDSTSTATPDGGSVISASVGRFKAVFEKGNIDVRDFGAYGEDTTQDSYPAILAALNYTWSIKRVISNYNNANTLLVTGVPAIDLAGKKYLISSPLYLKMGQTLQNGALKAGTAGMTMIKTYDDAGDYLSAGYGQRNIVVRDLLLDGNNIGSAGLSWNHTEMCTVENVTTTRFKGLHWADNSVTVVSTPSTSSFVVSDTTGIKADDFIAFYDVTNSRYYPGAFQVAYVTHDTVVLYVTYFNANTPAAGSYVKHLPTGTALFGNKNKYDRIYAIDNVLGLAWGDSKDNNRSATLGSSRDDNLITRCYAKSNDWGAVMNDGRNSHYDQNTFMWNKYWSLTVMNGNGSTFTNTYLETFTNPIKTFAGLNNEDYQLAAIRGAGMIFGCIVPTNNSDQPYYRPIKVFYGTTADIYFNGTNSGHTWDNPVHPGDHSLIMQQGTSGIQLNVHIRNHTLAAVDSLKYAVVDNNYNLVANARIKATDPDTYQFNNAGNEYFTDTVFAKYKGNWYGNAIGDAYIASASTWNAKQDAITLTTTGSGAATLVGNNLNIPTASGGTTDLSAYAPRDSVVHKYDSNGNLLFGNFDLPGGSDIVIGDVSNAYTNSASIEIGSGGGTITLANTVGIELYKVSADGDHNRIASGILDMEDNISGHTWVLPDEDGTLETKEHAASTYASITSLNDYLLSSDAASTYATIANLNTTNSIVNTKLNITDSTNIIGKIAGITYRKKSGYNSSNSLLKNIVDGNAEFMGLNRITFGTVDIPAAFSYFTPTVRRGDILRYKTSVDEIRDWRDAYMNTNASKKVYYVSESGNDTYDGLTPATALRSIKTAQAKSDMITIRVLSGVYGSGNNQIPDGSHTGNYNLICSQNTHIGAFYSFSGFAWDATYTNLATVTNANVSGITAVYDRLALKKDGTFEQFRLATSVADCATKFKSYYITGTTIYINYHTLPGNDYNTVLFAIGGRMVLSGGTSSYNVYVEGGNWYGTVQLRSQGNAGTNPTAYLRDMNIVKSSGPYDVLWDEGYDVGSYNVSILQAGTQDAFNYHKYLSGNPTKNFEINNKVLYQQGQGASDQASTLHDSSYCVTINCEYGANGEQIIHDIDGSKRAIFGSVLSASNTQGSGSAVVRAANSTMYLENCSLEGSTDKQVYVADGGIMYFRGTLFESATIFNTSNYTLTTW